MVRFAHLADCHIGAWRDASLRSLADQAFTKAVTAILESQVDFVIIAGDLFNTALPGIDHVKHVTRELQRLKQANIPVYVIAGSHDYSPTGKTMLDVLEEAHLCINVFKGEVVAEKLVLEPVQDPKTRTWITGILGKAQQLDSELYEQLDTTNLEQLSSPKIFLFHTTLTELKPKSMSKVASKPVSFMPKGFDYYAGGHVHIVDAVDLPGYKNVVYPGPLFPASFSELEELSAGGFYIVDLDGESCVRKRIDICIKPVRVIDYDCANMASDAVTLVLESELAKDVDGKIVLVRLRGQLATGTTADIPFRKLFMDARSRGAYHCLRNTVALSSPQFEEIDLDESTTEEVEASVIREHAGQIPLESVSKEQEVKLMENLFSTLCAQPHEGETKKSFEDRIIQEGHEVLRNA